MIELACGARKLPKPFRRIDMKTLRTKALLVAAVALAVALSASPAQAFWGHHRQAVVTTNYALPTVPVTAAYAPVVVARPVIAAPVIAAPVVASPVVTAGFAPTATFAAPTTAFYAPAPTVVAPTTTFFAPAPAATFAAPTTTFFAPAPTVVAPAA